MKENLRHLWQQRTPAERRTLRSVGAILAIALMYAFVWHPLAQERQRLGSALPQLRAAAAKMHVQAQEIARTRNLPQKPLNNNLRSAVDDATTRSSINAPSEFLPLDAGRARVTFNNTAFDRWIEWVKFLQVEQGIRVESADITALAESGTVKIQAVLAPSGVRP